jgi:hypothetical protein
MRASEHKVIYAHSVQAMGAIPLIVFGVKDPPADVAGKRLQEPLPNRPAGEQPA